MNGPPRPALDGVTAKMKTSAELSETESDKDLLGPFQIQSYDDLLKFPELPVSTIDTPSGKRAITEPIVDAIVVPTIRTAEHLRPAAQLAASARCHLIAVYTDSPPTGLSSVLDGLRPGQVTLLTVRSGSKDRLLDLGAALPQGRVSLAALDISRKRNLGLLIGRICGWTRLLFLDDDIRKISVAKLSSAAALLDDYPVVGLQVRKYPDASVVGHARRLTGRRQEPFVSGGALLVNPQLLNGYFPPTYHEDWLCIINHLRAGEVAVGGWVGQKIYLPFTTSERAMLEEFGDILAAGLLWLAHGFSMKGDVDEDKASSRTEAHYWREATNPSFWERILEERAVLLEEIVARFTAQNLVNPSALHSLAAAKQRLGELKPADFVSFTEKWLTSLAEWRGKLSILSPVDLVDKVQAIDKALSELGLGQIVRTHEMSSQSGATWRTRWMGGFAGLWSVDSRVRFGLSRWL